MTDYVWALAAAVFFSVMVIAQTMGVDSQSAAVVIFKYGTIVSLLIALINNFLPWVNAKIAARFRRIVPYSARLTPEGLVYLAIMITVFVAALVGQKNVLLLVFSLLAGPFILNGSVTLMMLKNNQIERVLPERVMEGESFGVEILIRNRRRMLSSWLMLVEDEVQNHREHLKPRVLFARVPPRDVRTSSYRLHLNKRGEWKFGPMKLVTRFPLGFMERSYTQTQPGRVLVYPKIGKLLPAWFRENIQSDDYVHQADLRAGHFDDEFHRLREYRPGDNLRMVHWKSSAKQQELIVREYHQNREPRLAILVDLFEGTPTEIENALRLVATVLVESVRQKRETEIWLGINAKTRFPSEGTENKIPEEGTVTRFQWTGEISLKSLPSLLDALSLAERGGTDELQNLITHCDELAWSNLRRVLITARPSPIPAHSSMGHWKIIPSTDVGIAPFCRWENG